MRLTEKHFEDLFTAAWLAKEAGEDDLAERLDVMARKANLEITRAETRRNLGAYARTVETPETKLTWKDMPSVFDT